MITQFLFGDAMGVEASVPIGDTPIPDGGMQLEAFDAVFSEATSLPNEVGALERSLIPIPAATLEMPKVLATELVTNPDPNLKKGTDLEVGMVREFPVQVSTKNVEEMAKTHSMNVSMPTSVQDSVDVNLAPEVDTPKVTARPVNETERDASMVFLGRGERADDVRKFGNTDQDFKPAPLNSGDIAVLPESRGSGHATNRDNLIPTVIPSDRPIFIRRSSVDSFIGLDAEPKVRTQFEGTSSKALAPQSTSSEPSRTDVSQDHAGKKQPDRVKTADAFILGVRQNVPSPATAVETVVLLHEVGKQQSAMFEVPSNSDQTRVSFDNETPVQRPDSSQKVRQHSIEGAPVVGPKQPSDLPNNSVGVFSNVSNGPRAQEISTAALSNNEERAIPPKTTTFDQADERSRLPDPLVHSKPDLASDRGAGGTPAASQALENLHGTRDEVKGATSMENGAFAGEAETRRVGASAINASGTADTKLGASLPVMTQLSEATRTASTGLIEVRLSPEELGRVKLFLSPSDAGLSVTFLTERPETMELIRRHVEIFANDLRLQGHQNLSFQFGQNNDPSSHLSNSDETQGELTSGEDQSSPPNIAHLPNKTAVDGRLDLRL